MDARARHHKAMPDGAAELHLLADEDQDAGRVDQPAHDQQAQRQRVHRLDHRLEREHRHPAEQDVDHAPEGVRQARRQHLHRCADQSHRPDGGGEPDRPGPLEAHRRERRVAARDHQEDGRLVQPPQHGPRRAGMGQVVDGRGRQHGHQAKSVDRR